MTVTVVSGATFSGGQAQGEMTGYGWVAMGTMGDAVTDPVCGTTQPYQPITAASPCTTQTDWSSPTALCMTGTIAALPAAPTQTDYSNNWGIEVGANANTDPTIAIGRSYASISVSITGSPTSGLRVNIHRKGDPALTLYCAAYAASAIPLTAFNTTCWDNSGTAFTVADAPKIDRVSIRVPSGSSPIGVTNLCMTGITFY